MANIISSYSFTPETLLVTAGEMATGRLDINWSQTPNTVQVSGRIGTAAPTQCSVSASKKNDYSIDFTVDASMATSSEVNTVDISVGYIYMENGVDISNSETFSCPFSVNVKSLDAESGGTIITGGTIVTGGTSGSTDIGGVDGEITGGGTSISILTATPSEVEFDTYGGSYNIRVDFNNPIYNDTVNTWAVSQTPSDFFNAVITAAFSSSCIVNVSADENTEAAKRTGSFYVLARPTTAYTPTFRLLINVSQESNAIRPVWRDELFTIESEDDSINYKIVDDATDKIIYAGKAVKLPDSDSIKLNIAKLISNELTNSFPTKTELLNNVNIQHNYCKTFNIVANDSVIGTYSYYNSWGYEDLPSDFHIAAPIRPVVDRRQYLFTSLFNPSLDAATINIMAKPKLSTEDYNLITVNIDDLNPRLITLPLFNFPVIDRIRLFKMPTNPTLPNITYLTYDVIDSCCEYCLYYCNAFGGWDSLLVNGNVKKSDKITSHYYSQNFNNTTYEFEKTKYLNVISTSYELYTDWFNDDEQSRLYHLLESTQVYLHNLNKNEILPVNITNNTCEYKTYTNNGKKKWYNTINVEVAQERIRQ